MSSDVFLSSNIVPVQDIAFAILVIHSSQRWTVCHKHSARDNKPWRNSRRHSGSDRSYA